MDGFGPVDLFATKGIEYLIVIGFLLVLVAYWRLLNTEAIRPAAARASAMPPQSGWFALKDGYHFHQGHTWAAPSEGRLMSVGMDDFAVKLLGKPESFELPRVGTRVKQGERAWQVKIDSKTIPVLSPVDGKVVAVNQEVISTPDTAHRDPYGDGWLIKVRVPNRSSTLKNLISGRLAGAWLESTVERLREMQTGELGILLPDGGFPVDGFARNLSPDRWDEIARRFLLTA